MTDPISGWSDEMWLLMNACARANGAVDAFFIVLLVVVGRTAAGLMRVRLGACVVIIGGVCCDSLLICLSLDLSQTLKRLS